MPFVEGGIVVDAEQPEQQTAPQAVQSGFVEGGITADPTPDDSYNMVLQYNAAQTDFVPSKRQYLDFLQVSKTKPLLGETPLSTIGTAAVQTVKDIASIPYKLGEAIGQYIDPPEGVSSLEVAGATAAEIAMQSKLKAQSMGRGLIDTALNKLSDLTGKLRNNDDKYAAFLASAEIKRQLARANAPEDQRVPASQEVLQAYGIPQEAISQEGLEVGGFLADPSSIAFAGGGKLASTLAQRALPFIPRAGRMLQSTGESISSLGRGPENLAGRFTAGVTGSERMGQAVQEGIARGATSITLVEEAAGIPMTMVVPGLGTAAKVIAGTKAVGATAETVGEATAVSGGQSLTATQRGLLGAGERIAAAEGASASARALGTALARSGLETPIRGAATILLPMAGAGAAGGALTAMTGEEGDAIAASIGSGIGFGVFDGGFKLGKTVEANVFNGARVRKTAVDDLNTRPIDVQFTYIDPVAGEQTATIKDSEARATLYGRLNNKQLTKALSEVAGAEGAGVDVIFHTDADTVPAGLQNVNYAGVAIGPDNIKSGKPTILINVDKASPEALPHEILHARITQDIVSQLGAKAIDTASADPNFQRQFTDFANKYADKLQSAGGRVVADRIRTELRDAFDPAQQRAQKVESLKRITDEFAAYYTQEMLKGKDPKTMLPGRIPSFLEMALNNAKEAVSERFTRRALQAGFDPVARTFYDANGRRIKLDWMEDAIKNLVTPKEGYEPTEQKVDIRKMTQAQQNAVIMARGYSDLFMTAPDGSIVRPLSRAEVAARTADIANRTMRVVESVPQADRTSISGMDAYGNPVIEGRLSLAEADAVSKSGIFGPSSSRTLIDIATAIRDGSLVEGNYWKVYGPTGRSGVFGESQKLFLPYGISINSKGGVNVKVVDWGKVQARMYKALGKQAYKNLFNNYDQAMSTMRDVYLKNIAETGAVPSAEALGGGINGAKKRNMFNEIMGAVPKKGDVMVNFPTTGYVANRKGGSVYQDLRLERIQNADSTGAKIFWTGDMGEQSSYRRTQLNFMPAENIGETKVSTDENAGYRILSKNGKFRLYGPDGSTVGIFDTQEQAKLKAEKDYATQTRLQPEISQQQRPLGDEGRQATEAGGRNRIERGQEGQGEGGAVRQADDVRFMPDGKSDGLAVLDDVLKLELPRRPKVIDIANAFQNLFGKAIEYRKANPQDNAKLVGLLVQEIDRAVKLHPEAKGWYDENVKLTMDVMRDLDPDISKPENDFIFKAILAATSDGNKVGPQFQQTWKEYSNWKNTGEISGEFVSGDRIDNIQNNLVMLNEMIKDIGWEKTKDFMVQKGTVKSLRQSLVDVFGWTKKQANSVGSAERVDEVVPFAVVLGPKLGSFFNNLYGDFSSVTMDRWFMRTLGRLTGTQVAPLSKAKLREMRNNLRDSVSRLTPSEFALLGVKRGDLRGTSIDDTATTISGRFSKKALRETAKQSAESGQSALEETRKFANALKKGLNPLVEAPVDGTHRRWIRERIAEVQKELRSRGIELENADLQAVLWYLEKELYEKLNYRSKSGESDYASAASSLYQSVAGRPSDVYAGGTGRVRAIGSDGGSEGMGAGQASQAPGPKVAGEQRFMPASDMASGRSVKDHGEAVDLFEKGYRIYGAPYDGMEDPIRLKKVTEIDNYDPENLWAVPSKKQSRDIGIRNMPASDTDYLSAMKQGDTATAQRMVDAAAKKAGYDSELLYRGRSENSSIPFFGKDGAHFTSIKEYARSYGEGDEANVISGYAKITNALRVDLALSESTSFEQFRKHITKQGVPMDTPARIFDWSRNKDYKNTSTISEALTQLQKDMSWTDFQEDPSNSFTDNLGRAVWPLGFDAIRTFEHGQTDIPVVILKQANQIKSADPITYDKSGNVIPLSKRFKATSEDIRYMPSEIGEKSGRVRINLDAKTVADIDPATAEIRYSSTVKPNAQGRLETSDGPNGEIVVENHYLSEELRGKGYGGEAIRKLQEMTGRTIISDENPSAAARAMWDRLGAKRESVQLSEDESQMRYVLRSQRAPVEVNKDFRYMPTDTEYLTAVKQGDTKVVQRMVDKAAKAAGYTTKVFHGSSSNFTKPNTPLFLGDEGMAATYAQNRAMMYGEGAEPVMYRLYGKFNKTASEDMVKQVAQNMGFEVENDMAFSVLDPQISPGKSSRLIQELKKRGYDSAKIDDFSADDATKQVQSIVAFNPSQLKLADPITKDNAGNVIPLSQRFKATSEDIRYMPEKIQRDVGRNQDFANPPTDTEAVDALSSEKKAKFGAARSIKPGTQVAARIDIPAFLRTGKYVVAVHEPDGAAGGPGKVIGYDTVTRLQNPKFVVKPGVQRIYEGRSAKFPVATVDGKIMADRSIPADLENYVAVGMDPKEHAFFYDKRTDQPVIGGSEAVSVGNTVFVKNPVYGKPEDFRYMPQPDSAMPGAYSFPGGYRALPGKAKGSLRLYGPAGNLVGIASSLDEAQRILRRKNK